MTDTAHRALAIVGVSAILPDAPDVGAFWQNVRDGHYSISDVDPARWDPELYYAADASVPDKTYSKLGGWVRNWEWDPMGWRLPIPPRVSDSMDEAQKWAVACARSALLDFGWPDRKLDLERTAVVVGNAMSGEMHYLTALRIHLPRFERMLSEVSSFGALPEDVRRAITGELEERFDGAFPEITEDTMPGELANCMAGRIANLFDLRGPNFVCDAACAAALSAIDAAAEGLIDQRYDAALVGGVDRNMGPEPFVKFSKIGALSATGTRPYADGADGFVMGEGAAFFLLKRLADAERDGDRVYAVLRGIGGASDGKGKGITAPNPRGQRLAIERAWKSAGVPPQSVGLIEGHGTSTRVGDVVEVQSLNEVFGGFGLPADSIPLGSVKSNIGHLKGAAGAAGLLKTVMALHEKTLPPSLNFATPNPAIGFEKTPFHVNREAKPWDPPPDGVRRAGVSAFGFGGTNFHAVVEEHLPGRLTSERTTVAMPSEVFGETRGVADLKSPLRGALVLGAASAGALRARLEQILADARAGSAPLPGPPSESDLRAPERIAIDYGDAGELATRAERALKAMDADQPSVWNAVRSQAIFRGSGAPPKMAFLYTGQGSQYPNMLRELRETEPIVRETFAEADRVMEAHLDRPLSEYIFVDPEDEEASKAVAQQLRQTEITQPAVLTVDTALTRLLAAYGIVPDFVMGHSLGEYAALVASGALPFEDALLAVSARGREMADLSVEDVGRMAAVFAPLDQVQEIVEATPGNVVVANVNSRTQAVIGGATEPVTRAIATFEERGVNVVPLPVSHAFHTTIVAPASEPLRRTLQGLRLAAPEIPLVGNVDGQLYPTGPDARERIVDLLAAQVASPVQFVKGLETLHAEGVRVALEVGPKKALQGFAADVLGDRPDFVALFSNHPKIGEIGSFNQALCGCYAAGIGLGAMATAKASPPAHVAPPATGPQVSEALTPRAELPADRYTELGRLFAEFLERGQRVLGGDSVPTTSRPVVVTGVGLGLPGGERVFDDANVEQILQGRQAIDVIPSAERAAMVDKHITRLVKEGGGGPHFESIEAQEDVIKLAARAGAFDLEQEFGIPAERVPALDLVTRLAIGAGIEALRDAGLPLVQHYRATTKGTFLPERWMLPEPLRDETGIIFASAFPGFDSFADELTRYHQDRGLRAQAEALRAVRERAVEESGEDGLLVRDLDHRLHELGREIEQGSYEFDRRFLFRILPMGHSQFAEYIGARGPNTHINSACASTTQAFALAEDWIRAGRCRRVIVIGADDATSEHLLEWIGAGFLSTGAAATDEVVEKAALPFDRRRHGMILGMGAVGVALESPECASERGLRPICEVLSTVTANSAFHGTRLDIEHIQQVMEKVVSQAEQRFGLDRGELARELVFVSHETYTPARGGSASAEVQALRSVFGDAAEAIVVANTKGLTGHPMGVGIEDVVAIASLETGLVPPVPNFREPDPELGPLHLSRGGAYPIRYALRLGAGFGSQISLTLMRWVPSSDGARPEPDMRGFEQRLDDAACFDSWLQQVSGDPEARLEVDRRTLRVIDRGPATRLEPQRPAAAPVTRETSKPAAVPVVETPAAAPSAPVPPEPPAAAAPDGDEAEIRARVLGIVAEKTGYPEDMLDLELDLEADLGIDTVKQAETFAAIREAYGIPRDENLQLRDYPTLARAIQFVQERRPAPEGGAAAPSAAAAAAPDGDEAEIRARVLGIVAEKTGYPEDMLDLELDLEADLGIDTVKQAETFAAIREAYGIPRDENLQLRDYPTLARAIQFVQERRPAPEGGAAAPSAAAAAAPDGDEAEIRARVLGIVAEKTGYPEDMLDLELDLEADLGIDTVKQAETFAAIREAYGIPRDENLQLRDYPTLARAIQFVQERRPAPEGGAAAPSAAAAAAPDADEAEIRARVLGIVAEKTGYPEDMLDLELDLEADLGIDTVKQAETFAAIREAYGIPRDENLQLRDYPTLARAIQFVQERRPAPEGGTAAEAAAEEREEPEQPEQPASGFRRRIPVAVLRPDLGLCKPTGVELAEGQRVVVMPDRGGVARALVRRLEQRGVEVLSLAPDLESSALVQQLETWTQAGPIHGVYWLPALDAEGAALELSAAEWRAGLQLRVKLLYATARALFDQLGTADRFLVCGTRLGGRHGYDDEGALDPMGGAVVGFAKAFARERPGATVKAVDFPASRRTAELADALLDEALQDPGCVEVGRHEQARYGVGLQEATDEDAEGVALGRATVAMLTGAAGGIVSAITADLARAGVGTFHLLDLSPAPDPADQDVARFGTDREGLKREIFERLKEGGGRATPVQVERELARIERLHEADAAIRAITSAGGTAHWHQVDLTDAEAVAKVVDEVCAKSGRVDVLVHAAGLEVSRSLPEKEPQEFDRVFDVKCDGWFHLISALRDQPLEAVVLFSSIAGRFGNAGQTDYSAANDLLCKSASHLRRTRPKTRALAIDWTAWSQIGMASRGSIPDIMARAGIDMLSPDDGIPVVRNELARGGLHCELLAAGALGVLEAPRDETGGLDVESLDATPRGPMLGSVLGMGPLDGLRIETRLDPREQPFLNDHRIDGTAVLPGVMGIEAFVEAASLPFPSLDLVAVEDVEFLAPFKFYRDEPRELEVQAQFTRQGEEVVAECRLLGRRTLPGRDAPQLTLHFSGRVRLGGSTGDLPRGEAPPSPSGSVLGPEDLYQTYFHGPAYQVVGSAWRSGNAVVAQLAEGLLPNHQPAERPLATQPRLLELCFQAAGAEEIAATGRMGLPARIDRVRFGQGGEQQACAVVAPREPGSPASVVVVDEAGHALVELEGYATVAMPVTLDAAAIQSTLG